MMSMTLKFMSFSDVVCGRGNEHTNGPHVSCGRKGTSVSRENDEHSCLEVVVMVMNAQEKKMSNSIFSGIVTKESKPVLVERTFLVGEFT